MTEKLIGNLKRGLIFILSAPAGTGKTTLVEKLVQEYSCIVKSISYTTRQPRAGEISGTDYHFVSEETFKEKIAANEFLEYVKLYGDFYGTSRSWVEQQLGRGRHVLLVIDTQGAQQLRERVAATSIFLKPPSLEELERRLKIRDTESEAAVIKRLKWANQEMEKEKEYDYQIINDDLEIAYQVLKSIIIAEEHRIKF